MKSINVFFVLLVVASLFIRCEDNNDNDGEKISDLSVEEHKENLEQSGINVVEKLDGLANLEAINVIQQFFALSDGIIPDNQQLYRALQPVVNLKDGADAAFNLKSELAETGLLQSQFNELAGIYSYNSDDYYWDKEDADGQIIFYFPTEGSDENNAVLSITNFSSVVIGNSQVDDENNYFALDLLKTLSISLTVDDKLLMDFNFSADYDDDGNPVTVEYNYSLEEYKIATSASRTDSKVIYDQAFTFNDDNIITTHFESTGDFDFDVLEQYDDFESAYDAGIIEASNIWIIVDNIKFQGIINWKEIDNFEDQYNENESEGGKEYSESFAEVLNNNFKLYVKYNDKNEIIAMSEFYAREYSGYVNGQEQSFWDVDLRFKFGDGSYVDDSFFSETSFADFIEEANDLINALEDSYGLSQP